MPAYVIIRVNIRDRDAYGEYMLHTPRILDQFGGRFIVRGGEMETLEGEEEKLRMVVVEFPSMHAVRDFYRSKEYQQVKKLRKDGGEAQFVAVDGYPAEEWDRVRAESKLLSL